MQVYLLTKHKNGGYELILRNYKLLLFVFLILILSKETFCEVPNKFFSGTKAKASEVNENFEYLDNRLVSLEKNIADMGYITYSQPHELDPYIKKNAKIGDIVAKIENTEYVLGALPFKEYKTGYLYKVFMPLARYECNRSESEINDNNGYLYIDNYHCENGSKYYYEESFRVEHTLAPIKSDFTISGFPAQFTKYWGEDARIALSSSNETINTEYNDTADPKERNYEKSITTNISVNCTQVANSLNVLVNETKLTFNYSPIYGSLSSSYKKILSTNSGPDFSLSIHNENLNNHMDQELMNQYKDLYNYIRIERMD